ncbi:MAG: DUF58 domain-containing protein [Gemmatimonadetes bacterium]|nr:DUF58 domain-containing protein [Gemmatimonadota bacterium]
MASDRYGALLDALHGLRWPARRRAAGGVSGSHAARQRGPGGEFAEVRPYRQGDDPRQLDWRVLARTDRPYVRLLDDRVARATWLVLDATASMAYPSADVATGKWGMARALAVGLASVAVAGGDPVGVMAVHAGGVLRLDAAMRRGVVAEVATRLDALRCDGEAPLAPALAMLPPRARVVVCTDGLADAAAQRREAARHVAGGAEVTCVQLVAREELTPPAQPETARDPEGGFPDQRRDAAGWPAYLARFEAFRGAEAAAWRAVGARWVEVRADEAPADAVRRVVRG